MNLDSLTAALSHIGNLIVNLTKRNLNSSVQEVKELIDIFGGEAELHLYRIVLSQLEWSLPSADIKTVSTSLNGNTTTGSGSINTGTLAGIKEKESTGTSSLSFSSSNGPALILLIQHFLTFVPVHRFASCFAIAISTPLDSVKIIRQGWTSGILKLFKLTKVQEVILSLELLHCQKPEIRNQAINLLKSKLPDLLRSYIDADSAGREIADLSTETIHLILTQTEYTLRDQVEPELRAEFLSTLQKEFPRLQAPLVLLPILYPDCDPLLEKLVLSSSSNMAKSLLFGSLPDLVLEMGYGFCSSLEECRNNLTNLGIANITPLAVAKTMGIMAKTHTGLQSEQLGMQSLNDPSSLWNESKDKSLLSRSQSDGSTWNVEIFIKAVLEVVPTINVKEVIVKLDHKGFHIKDKSGLVMLFTALRFLLQGQGSRMEHFPVDALYRQWKCSEEQLHFLEMILNNPDIFCFADYPCHFVATEGLKATPELDNKAVLNWKSLQLIEILLYLGEIGHSGHVKELFKFPMQHCPDLLLLGLVQVNISLSPFSLVRQEMLSALIPVFLATHPNSTGVLHHVWHSQKDTAAVRQVMMHSMAEWYMMVENDQSRLSRILDIAQDLKTLSLLLNAQPFAFVIDLACLAYRREYLKLDKWLPDKIREHGEAFISACVKFLQRRCPQLLTGKEELLPKSAQLPSETVSTMLSCLQSCVAEVPQELSDAIITMAQNCSVLNRPRQMSLLGFPSHNDSLGIASGLNSLSLGVSASSSIFPQPVSSSISLGSLGTLGPPAPISPARPLPPVTPVQSSQSSLSSILPPLQLPVPPHPHPAIGSQLQQNSSILSSSNVAGNIRPPAVQTSVTQPRQTVDIAQIFDISPIISKEVEDEANSYFQRIYNHSPHPTLSIDDVLEMLKKFHESGNKREDEVFTCMLKNLFEEYRFFPTYPNRELILTARLFGGIIEQGLVEYQALGVALRYVLEALQKPHGSKMYYFGIVALDRFRSRLKEYHRYCHHLMAIEHFNEFPPHLTEYIKYGTHSQEPPNRPSGAVLPATMSISPSNSMVVSSTIVTPTATGGASVKPMPSVSAVTTSSIVARPLNLAPTKPTMATTNIETLLVATEKEEKISIPPDHSQDKIAFIFNNLSQRNLSQKCEELKEILTEEYHPWLTQYLVMKRASIENNFHTLYSLFLDQLNMPTVSNSVLQETLRNVKVLLRADKSSANLSDKSLLKHLGHWLGMLTLSKNKPILHIDIDVKSLVIEAYKKGLQEMQYVVPFVAKVLESCSVSRVFKPPNPWTMAIMNLLAELHGEPDMKLHLKFEIEVLCKRLELEVKDLKPGETLKNAEKITKFKPQLAQPTVEACVGLQTSAVETVVTPPAIPSSQSASTPTQIQPIPVASEPRFVYNDISLSSLRCFESHISISTPQLGNAETNTQLKQLVRQAVELAVQDIITAVIEWSTKVSLATTELVIKKDFALEPDESRMRAASHHIVRNLTAAMAMITSKDHLTTAIAKGVKQGILTGFNRQTNPQQMEQVDQLANTIAVENTAIACAFIQKTAAEKAVLEIDKKMLTEYEARKLARAEGRRYCDARALTYQAERMPEQIRLKVGRVTQQQTVVYEAFARNIPGFAPVVDEESVLISKPVPIPTTLSSEEGSFFVLFDRITQELELTIQTFTQVAPSSQLIQMLHSLLEGIVLCRNNRDSATAQFLIKRNVENLLEGIRDLPSDHELNQVLVRFRDVHLIVLKAMADPRTFGASWTSKCVAKCWVEAREEIRYNLDVVDWLLKSNLINVQMMDEHLSRAIEEQRTTYTPLLFVMQLVQVYMIDDTSGGVVSESDLHLTLEAAIRLCQTRQAPDGLVSLIETLRIKHDRISNNERLASGVANNSLSNALTNSLPRGVSALQMTSSHHFHSGVTQARDFNDPPGLHEKTDALLRQWIQFYHSPNAGQGSTTAFQHFVKEMDVHGILKTDEVITRFFRICITMCRDLCVRTIVEAGSTSSATYVRNKCFPNLDAFVRLIVLLVKQSGEPSNPTAKINLLNKVLGLVCGIMLHDIETHGNDFHQLPYHRILIMLFLELNAPETVLESINLPVLMAFTQTLHLLRPSKCPGFSYAWLEMVSHRVFIGRMLAITPQQKGWSMYSMLLTDLFKFLAPFLRNVELSKPFTMLYKGTLRVLLVLLHDFPEFLCEYHYTFCDVIPPNCIQMRNLILSAYPRNMRLPDPFMPNLKVDRLQEIAVSPKINTNVGSLILPTELKKNLDSYLKNRNPVTFLTDLRSYLQVSNEPGNRYNMSVMNALVLYVGMQAILVIQNKGLTPSMSTIGHSSHMDIFENLAVDLDTEGRYLFLIAIANQLRYPSSHTHYFSCTLLYLFTEANTEAIQEQITRVLLERLIGNKPQPWGLLITFIELIKNPSFKFWSHEFVKCAPEIEKIFESIAHSCIVSKGSQVDRE